VEVSLGSVAKIPGRTRQEQTEELTTSKQE